MPLPSYLQPRATDDLVRVGAADDGGYVMPARTLAHVRQILGMGLNDDWSFEADLAARTGAPVVIFDHTVDWRFWLRRTIANLVRAVQRRDRSRLRRAGRVVSYRRFFNGTRHRHVQRAIGRRADGHVDLAEALHIATHDRDVALKVDIEGAEYTILDQIVADRDRFAVIVMELHLIDENGPAIERFLKAVSDRLALVHLHANNFENESITDTSRIVEVTLLDRTLLRPDEELVQRALPVLGLDHPSVHDRPDVVPVFE